MYSPGRGGLILHTSGLQAGTAELRCTDLGVAPKLRWALFQRDELPWKLLPGPSLAPKDIDESTDIFTCEMSEKNTHNQCPCPRNFVR